VSVKTVVRKRYQCTCEVCRHTWESPQIPTRCAKCKSPYWNRQQSAKKRKR